MITESGAILVAMAFEAATVFYVIVELVAEACQSEPDFNQVPWISDLFVGTVSSLMSAGSH